MFAKLFLESGLSIDRLRALVEVGASGSIVRAAGSDPVRQSQYSRQLKELEDFFETGLVERHGKGIRLTASGKELARISRFFLMGLSNFQRGCLAEGQTYRIGASPTFISSFLLPVVADPRRLQSGVRFRVEAVADLEIQRRLHDLTLDFGIVSRPGLSRPLQSKALGAWRLRFLVPKILCKTARQAAQAFREKRLPIAWATGESPLAEFAGMTDYEPVLSCGDFLQARTALESGGLGGFIPDFLRLNKDAGGFLIVKLSAADLGSKPKTASSPGNGDAGTPLNLFGYHLAWNPRLLRLNPHAHRRRDAYIKALTRKLSQTGD